MKLYQDVLQVGWKVAHKQSQLWVLGLFAALITGVAGELDRFVRLMSGLFADDSALAVLSLQSTVWGEIFTDIRSALLAGDMGVWALLALVALAIIIVLYMIGISQAGLVAISQNENKSTLREAMIVGQRFAPTVVAYQLSGIAIITLVSYLVRVGVQQIYNTGAQYWLVVLAVLAGAAILFAAVLYVSYIIRYAICYVVLHNARLVDGIVRAHQLLVKHLFVTIEMSFVIFALAVAINVGIVALIGITMAPFSAISYTMADFGEESIAFYNAVFIGGVIYLGSIILVTMIFSVWQWAAWTALFQRLQKEQPTAKLVRALGRN